MMVDFQSEAGNRYLHSGGQNQFLLCHPVLSYLVGLHEGGIDPGQWLDQLKGTHIKIENYGTFSKKEIRSQYKKFRLLLENGYFAEVDIEKKVGGRLWAEKVRFELANTRQVVFETTDGCNLRCKYCAYGDLYADYDRRENKTLNVETARVLLDYIYELWNSNLNTSHDRLNCVSFYGGEPLLNFDFIEEMVAYVKGSKLLHNRFYFGMTTNGLLLEKHMDFLVKNDFHLLVSLDGDEGHNAYRVYPNGKPAFSDILKNIQALKDRYPDFFPANVQFNAVLHNRNSLSGILNFFRERFDKIPLISEVNPHGVRPEKRREFMETYKNLKEELGQSKACAVIEREMFEGLPNIRRLITMIHQYTGYVFKKYDQLLKDRQKVSYIPTGTCLPFSRKIFATVNGKLLPCERIGHQFGLGKVDRNGVDIDFQEVADTYNNYYEKLNKQCRVCHNIQGCPQCLFTLDITADDPVCKGFMNQEGFKKYLKHSISQLEENPEYFSRIYDMVVD